MKTCSPHATLFAVTLLLPSTFLGGNSLAADTTGQITFAVPALQAAVADSTDRIIVKYRESATDSFTISAPTDRFSRLTGYAMTHLGRTHDGALILKLQQTLPLETLHGIIREIERNAEVEYAEPDLRMFPLYTPNDPRYNEQWHYYEETGGIDLPPAWDLTRGEHIVVAVVDTGYLPHQDLLPNLLPGYDMISDPEVANDGDGRDAEPLDPGDVAPACGTYRSSWHGTHVAGTVAAVAGNDIGVTGVAFQAKIQPVRVLGKCGGYLSDIADGIIWASGADVGGLPTNQTPAQVISLSLGASAPACTQTMQLAIDAARQMGATLVVAAGNDGLDSDGTTPANCDGVITVAATTRAAERASFSNYGEGVDIAAPGEQILSTHNTGLVTAADDSYAYANGTSMATPHVSGVTALLYAVRPELTPQQAEQILKTTARPFPAPCNGCGAGIVDAFAAVEAAIEGPIPDDPTTIMLENGVAETGLAGDIDTRLMFAIDLPSDATDLSFSLSGGTGDADLYVRYGEAPSLSSFDCRPYLYGNSESCLIGDVQAGRYYAMLHGYDAFSGATLVAKYRLPSDEPPAASFENTTDYEIPNYRFHGVSSPINVPLERQSEVIDVEVDIKHNAIREIWVELLDPLGQSHSLKGFGGANATDLKQIYSLDLGSLPAQGTWALRVRDFGSSGSGYIDSWRITFR
ncbi:MAG: S8 family serine peptidase [Candidatus Thiodiazotropha sp.]